MIAFATFDDILAEVWDNKVKEQYRISAFKDD